MTAQDKISELSIYFKDKIMEYKKQDLKIFASSSFQSHSIPMLHLISRIAPEIPVYFLDTGFHFPETIQFKNQVADTYGLKVISVSSPIEKIDQRNREGAFHFTNDTNYCCYLNKTLPMEPIIAKNDVWISGVRKDQSAHRSGLSHEMRGKHNILRFHPMLDWSNKLIWTYITEHNLPKHPLEAKGYLSIGCEPCTQKFNFAEADSLSERAGRWAGQNKTECGLHTTLIESENQNS